MKLDLANFPVREIRFGNSYRYENGRLTVDREDLVRIVSGDERIAAAKFETVEPGEHARITGVRDVVEPRAKFGARGQVFPGTIGPVESVGSGVTHRLSGMTVIATAHYEGTIRAGTGVQRSAMLDMWGPGAQASRFSNYPHLVLIMRLKQALGEFEAHLAIQRAEFAVARRIAQITEGARPQEVEQFELNEAESLPRVILIQGCITNGGQPHSGVSYYGLPIRESLATWIHPNELLDGAVTTNTTRGIGYYPTSWDWQNHPLASELYRQQAAGRLSFAGMIIERISYDTIQGKEVVAHNTAQLAAHANLSGCHVQFVFRRTGCVRAACHRRHPRRRRWFPIAPAR